MLICFRQYSQGILPKQCYQKLTFLRLSSTVYYHYPSTSCLNSETFINSSHELCLLFFLKPSYKIFECFYFSVISKECIAKVFNGTIKILKHVFFFCLSLTLVIVLKLIPVVTQAHHNFIRCRCSAGTFWFGLNSNFFQGHLC